MEWGNTLAVLGAVLAVLAIPLIAALSSWSVRYQLHQMGVPEDAEEEAWPAVRWPAFFGAVTFWGILILGLVAATNALGWPFASEALMALFSIVARFTIAGAVLASGGWLAAQLEELSDDPVRDRRVVILGSAVFAGGALVGVGTALIVVLGLLLLGVAMGNRTGRAQFADKLLDMAAGIRLRAIDPEPQTLNLGVHHVEIVGIGLFNTTIDEAGVEKVLRNEAVLSLVQGT